VLCLVDDLGFDPVDGGEIWTIPGASSPERRLTAGILKPLLSGARSPKLIGAGSPNTAPNKRLESGGISQRRHQEAQRVNEVLIRGWSTSSVARAPPSYGNDKKERSATAICAAAIR
jgi:hypothetical protein